MGLIANHATQQEFNDLITERDALAKQVRELREALEWYGKKAAEFAVWDKNPSLAEPAFQDLSNDAGQRALKARSSGKSG